MKYRADIDGLRAVAIASVVAYHAGIDGISGGFSGVDVFFVISGFLISKIIYAQSLENDFSFLDFYARRVRRILPALFAVVFVTFLISCFLFFPSEIVDVGKSIIAATLFSANIYFYASN